MNINIILIISYFFATMIIFCRNSLYSIVSLIFLVLFSSLILFSLKIEFLTFILLLIYIGAITIIFLFVVMMLQLDKIDWLKLNSNYSTYHFIYFLFIFKILFFIYFLTHKICIAINFISFEYVIYNKDINIFSNFLFNEKNDSIIFLSLFSQKYLLFITIGFILLLSMVGSIALCLIKKREYSSKVEQ